MLVTFFDYLAPNNVDLTTKITNPQIAIIIADNLIELATVSGHF